MTSDKNMKKTINTHEAPAPIGPYSQAVLKNNTLYISGQIAIDPKTGEITAKGVEEETRQVMENLKAVLKSTGMDFQHVLKTSIFLRTMDDFPKVNEIYSSYFTSDFPARETVAVLGLPKNVNVEISMIASL